MSDFGDGRPPPNWAGIQPGSSPDVEGMRRGLETFLRSAGFDTDGEEHLASTPRRVAETWLDDLLRGYRTTPE